MDAFHTLRVWKGKQDFALSDFELFVAILSALEWRSHNGTIRLVTDSRGAEYIRGCGIGDVWSGIDTDLDAMDSFSWDEVVFWAGAKLYALSLQTIPCVMMDLDFIVWRSIGFENYGNDVAVIHREAVGGDIYPNAEHFRFRDGWRMPRQLDWTVDACNTAFAYFGDRELVRKYTEFAFEFMSAADTSAAGLPYMVFVEQRWLAMCAAQMKRKIHSFYSLGELFGEQQDYFTHLWGEKDSLRQNASLASNFCRRCAARIKRDFPAWANKLQASEWAWHYFS